MPMTVLICGSPASGFQIIGLFANSADAQSYAEDYSLKDWWVAELGRVLINAQIGSPLSETNRKTFAHFETYPF